MTLSSPSHLPIVSDSRLGQHASGFSDSPNPHCSMSWSLTHDSPLTCHSDLFHSAFWVDYSLTCVSWQWVKHQLWSLVQILCLSHMLDDLLWWSGNECQSLVGLESQCLLANNFTLYVSIIFLLRVVPCLATSHCRTSILVLALGLKITFKEYDRVYMKSFRQ